MKTTIENPFVIESGCVNEPCGRNLLMEQVEKMVAGDRIRISPELQEKFDIKGNSIRSTITQKRNLKRRFKILTEEIDGVLVLSIYCLADKGDFISLSNGNSSCL